MIKWQVDLWSQALLSSYTHTPHFNPDKYDPHWGWACYEGVCGWQRVGRAPTPSAPMQRVMPTWGGSTNMGGTHMRRRRVRAEIERHATRSSLLQAGSLYQHLGSASSQAMEWQNIWTKSTRSVQNTMTCPGVLISELNNSLSFPGPSSNLIYIAFELLYKVDSYFTQAEVLFKQERF